MVHMQIDNNFSSPPLFSTATENGTHYITIGSLDYNTKRPMNKDETSPAVIVASLSTVFNINIRC